MLIGREDEFGQIESLLLNAFAKGSSASLSIYISGPPGTGKTRTVKAVVQKLQKQRKNFQFVSIDCFATYTAHSLSKEILTKLNADDSMPTSKIAGALDAKFASTRKPILILLDEIDNLLSRNNRILYTAFNWPAKSPGKVVVIGISNSLDLTERVLQKRKLAMSPYSIVFAAYTSAQLIRILEDRLSQEKVDAKAIELCARKISSMTGDVRRALDIASQMLANMEEEEVDEGTEEENEEKSIEKKQQLEDELAKRKENIGVIAQATTPQKMAPTNVSNSLKRVHTNPNDMGQVTPKKNACREVLNAINKTTASPCQRAKLPLHPRILLATLMRLLTSANPASLSAPGTPIHFDTPNRTPTKSVFTPPRTPPRTPNGKMSTGFWLTDSLSVSRDRLFQAYLRVCHKLQLKPLESDELNSAYEVLESQAMIKMMNGGGKKSGGQQRVCFMVEMSLARQTINDNALFTSIEELDL